MYSHYHHTGRRIFFWTLALIYIIAISIIIPYAFGYRFSFDRGVFVYAGSVTVKTNPRDVTVAIDHHTDKKPNYINDTYQINGITPGIHTLTIARDGFQSINKRISVSSGISTEFWNIILPRTHYERTHIATIRSSHFYRAQNSTLIAVPYRQKDSASPTLTIVDADDTTRKNTYTIPLQGLHIPDTTRNIEWSHTAKMLTIPFITQNTPTYKRDTAIITSDGTFITSLHTLFPRAFRIGIVRWKPNAPRTLYAHIDNALTEITIPRSYNENLKKDITTKLVANNVRAYTIAHNIVYYLTADTGIVRRLTHDGKDEQITTVPTSLPQDTPVELIVYDDDRVILRDTESGMLEFFDKTAQRTASVIAHNIKGVHFSDDGKKLLYWSDHEIFVRFVRSWDIQPRRTAGDVITLARFSTPIDNVQWAYDYEHVLYTTDNALKLTSLDSRGGRTTHTLLMLIKPGIVQADHTHYRIYITDGNKDGTYSLFYIHFPEKEALF